MVKRAGIEWEQLQEGLPAGINVFVNEERMDLLRATVEGPRGTPYEGGLFIFDIALPADYPAKPPQAHYFAFGKYINPNLYECGKVCLSLLGTWNGPGWDPAVSTLLQLLVSIQGLILIEHPYCNEPGQERDGGTKNSVRYNRACQAGVLDNMVRMGAEPLECTRQVVDEFLGREGLGLLQRARTYPNDDLAEGDVARLAKTLAQRGVVAAAGVAGAEELTRKSEVMLQEEDERMPSWLVVAEKPFTSGYIFEGQQEEEEVVEEEQDDY